MNICRLEDFDIGFKASLRQGSGAVYTSAVIEAIADCWTLLYGDSDKRNVPQGRDALIAWAAETFVSEDKTILPSGRSKIISYCRSRSPILYLYSISFAIVNAR